HLERLPVEPLPAADVARDVQVGQEVHLDPAQALALARLAPAPLHVEAEAAGGIAPDLGLAGPGEDLAALVEDPGIRRGGGAGPAPDRRLVDLDQLVDRVEPFDPRVRPGPRARLAQRPAHGAGEDLVDERALARPAHARDADERPEGEAGV